MTRWTRAWKVDVLQNPGIVRDMNSLTLREQVQAAPRPLIRVFSVLAVALLTGLSAWVAIPLPFTPVPLSLQTAVILGGAMFLGKDGFYAQILYLLLGGLGLPLFTGDTSSFQYLLSANGGYLIGFPLVAGLTAAWIHPVWKDLSYFQKWTRLSAMALLIFVPGVLQLKLVLGISWGHALAMGFVPFVIGDLMKAAVLAIPHKS